MLFVGFTLIFMAGVMSAIDRSQWSVILSVSGSLVTVFAWRSAYPDGTGVLPAVTFTLICFGTLLTGFLVAIVATRLMKKWAHK